MANWVYGMTYCDMFHHVSSVGLHRDRLSLPLDWPQMQNLRHRIETTGGDREDRGDLGLWRSLRVALPLWSV